MVVQSQFNKTTDHPVAVNFHKDQVQVTLADGRILGTPLARHPWLAVATLEQRNHYELGYVSIWWPDLDEGLDIEWMLRELNNPSADQPPSVSLISKAAPKTSVKSPRSQ